MITIFIEVAALLYAIKSFDLVFITMISLILVTDFTLTKLRKLHPIFQMLFPILILIYFLGSFFEFFSTVYEYDSLLHFAAGFVSTLLFASLYNPKKKKNLFATIIIVGLLIGGAWEFLEWLAGHYIPQNLVGDIDDTFVDLLTDSLGAVLAAGFAPIVFKRSKR